MCAVGAIARLDNRSVSRDLKRMLHRMQNRGQEQTGIVSFDETTGQLHSHKAQGLVKAAYMEHHLAELKGSIAIGHNRYSTAGASDVISAQPHLSSNPSLALAANGDIVPSCFNRIQSDLKKKGVYFNSDNDGELMTRYLAYHLQQTEISNPSTTQEERHNKFVELVRFMMDDFIGAYSVVAIYNGCLWAWRDPLGMRPLWFGLSSDNLGVYFASETTALDLVKIHHNAGNTQEVLPGEIHWVNPTITPAHRRALLYPKKNRAHCIFEPIYFSRTDSFVFGLSVYRYQYELGKLLAKKHPVEADVVFAIPDSSKPATLGFSRESGIPLDFGLIRDHSGRSFIEPIQVRREEVVREKYNAVEAVVKDKRCVVVDDSIVRATTVTEICQILREAEAREIHLRISSPPMTHPCHYGIDTPSYDELIASSHTVEEIRSQVGADSLGYLDVEDLREALVNLRVDPKDFCTACFNGKYPTVL